jgi:glutamine cyclotransferase
MKVCQCENFVESQGMKRICLRLVPALTVLACCPVLIGRKGQAPAQYTFVLIRVFPHDTSAYTQGLAYRDGFLYEGKVSMVTLPFEK